MNPVAKKFNEIHEDLEANVTKIYQRRDLMTVFDLVAHSVINFSFQGQLLRKGWCEALVVGDTRCGKSETVDKLFKHYHCGELVTGENASYAGLIGGLQQTAGNRWSITWGKYPLNDRRMLGIDELSGLPQESIAKMSGIRSSGVAEITKIRTEKTLGRVRSIWMSNPRGKRPIAAFNSGIEVIQDLIGHPEDIARFDLALTVATSEVPLHIINASSRPDVKHRYTTEACNRLVYWAWSRKADQVVFAPKAVEAVLSISSELSRRYVPPLVEGAEQRIKVARLAVSAAARVFSHTGTGEKILVLPTHVEFIRDFLDEIFCKPSMGFDLYSRGKIAESELIHETDIRERFKTLPADFSRLLTEAPTFNSSDVQDFASVDRQVATDLISFLVRKSAIRKGKFGYYKLPAFQRFLRDGKRAGSSAPL